MTEPRRFVALFLLCWALAGATTTLPDLRAYTLQQAGVDALVSHRTFTLGHSEVPLLQPRGDTFAFDGNVMAAKQPGQFVAGAIAYTVLRALGVTYEADYDRASAWTTWLSSGLFAALALAMLDRVLRALGYSSRSALLAVAALGTGSHWLAYASVAHHDVIATALLVFAARAAQTHRVFLAGVLLGLVAFVSMLPALIVAVAGLALALVIPAKAGIQGPDAASVEGPAPGSVPSRGRRTVLAAAGFSLGIAPLLAYNAWYFGNAFVPANVAGAYGDTFPAFDPARIAHHFNAYFGTHGLALWKYAPALLAGALALGASARKPLHALLVAACVVHLAYLLSIETLGTCQYGPRYLLPLLPAFALGVAWLNERAASRAVTATLVVLVVVGGAINMVGAIGGTMYCSLEQWALPAVAAHLAKFDASWLPLLWPALAVALAGLVALRQNWK